MSKHIVPLRVYFVVFIALLALTLINVKVVPALGLGQLKVVVTMAVAGLQALLVILYFMQIRYSTLLMKIVVTIGFFWLGILVILTLSDYLARGVLAYPNIYGKWPN